MDVVPARPATSEECAEFMEAMRRERRKRLHEWLDSDPQLREGFIELSPDLKRLARWVAKLERLAIGMRERTDAAW